MQVDSDFEKDYLIGYGSGSGSEKFYLVESGSGFGSENFGLDGLY